MINTIEENKEAKIEVKKSQFISNMFYVESEEDAKKYIDEIKSKYHDAKHVCYAYVIDDITEEGNSFRIEKSSDNGEPSGTAGAPMLDILKKSNLSNVLVTVTRYFGGILLGTGGLVRAYSDATQECLAACSIIKKEIGKEIKIVIDYSDQKNFKYQCDSIGINIVGSEFGEKIVEIIESNDENFSTLRNKAINFTTFEIQDEGKYKFIRI